MRMEKNIRNSRYVQVLWIITILLMLFFTFMTYRYGDKRITSDDASEMVLAELLHEEHAVISPNWYYSTELRVLNTQLVTAPLFAVFSDWTLIRTVRELILMVIMAGAYYFFCRNMKFGEKALLFLPFLVWPFSNSYTTFVLLGGYYVPHLAISFFSLGLFAGIIKGKYRKIGTALFLGLAFLAGMGGFRQVFILYVPLFVTAVFVNYGKYLLNRKIVNKSTILSGLGMLVAGGGLVFTNLLKNRYHWTDYSEISAVSFSVDRITDMVNGFLETLGYDDKQLFSSRGLVSMLAVAAMAAIVYLVIRMALGKEQAEEEERTYSVFVVWTFVMHMVLFLFTDAPYQPRYFIPLLIYVFPVLGICLKREVSQKDRYSTILAAGIGVCIIWGGVNVCNRWIEGMDTAYAQKMEAADFLTQEGYTFGYAEFWSANLFTELTDGFVQFHTIFDWKQDWNTLEAYPWLMRVENVDRETEDKVFILLNKERDTDFPECEYINEQYKVFENNMYIVYSYENTRQLKSLLPDVE